MRYIILVLLNIPVIFIALLNFITKYKMGRISRDRFRLQALLWITILIVLVASFPVYNLMSGRSPLDSHELSLFDVTQITVLILLIYIVSHQRQRIETNERRLRDLHQELSINLSKRRDP